MLVMNVIIKLNWNFWWVISVVKVYEKMMENLLGNLVFMNIIY